jgi:hypothetical protein
VYDRGHGISQGARSVQHSSFAQPQRFAAKREQLAAQERRLAKQIDDLRAQQDDLSNALHSPLDVRKMMAEELAQRPLDVAKGAAFIVAAGEKAKGRTPVPLPKDRVARLIVVSGMRARNEPIPDDTD